MEVREERKNVQFNKINFTKPMELYIVHQLGTIFEVTSRKEKKGNLFRSGCQFKKILTIKQKVLNKAWDSSLRVTNLEDPTDCQINTGNCFISHHS